MLVVSRTDLGGDSRLDLEVTAMFDRIIAGGNSAPRP
jgi:hypothetical protein